MTKFVPSFCGSGRPSLSLVGFVFLVTFVGNERTKAEVPEEERETTAQAPLRPAEMPLSPLPDPPLLELPRPRSEALEAIEGVLNRLISPDVVIRERAQRELLEAHPDWVSGLARQIDVIADRGGRSGLGERLTRARKRVRASSETQDTLEMVLAQAEPTSEEWRGLVQLLALNRMLKNIGSIQAVRELIRVYARFGDFIRVDVQNQLDELGDKALAGLIEATQHPAEMVSRWTKRQLDLRGKAIFHEAVRTTDQAALADILVAIGRTRNPDAGRLLISFASSEKGQLQLSARQGIALLGEGAAWQLRDAYLDTTGRRPPRDWTWKRTARELFTEFDRLRLAKVYEAFDNAQRALSNAKFEQMRQGYDEVLLNSPLFEARDKMAPGYIAYAERLRAEKPEEAVLLLRRAERVGTPEDAPRARALRLAIEAQLLKGQGIVDRGLIDNAAAIDPDSVDEEDLLGVRPQENRGLKKLHRYLLTIGVTLFSVAGAALSIYLTFRRRKLDQLPVASPSSSENP